MPTLWPALLISGPQRAPQQNSRTRQRAMPEQVRAAAAQLQSRCRAPGVHIPAAPSRHHCTCHWWLASSCTEVQDARRPAGTSRQRVRGWCFRQVSQKNTTEVEAREGVQLPDSAATAARPRCAWCPVHPRLCAAARCIPCSCLVHPTRFCAAAQCTPPGSAAAQCTPPGSAQLQSGTPLSAAQPPTPHAPGSIVPPRLRLRYGSGGCSP
jgi:hypothetical protein